MPIDGGLRDRLEAGTVLVATYKGSEYLATVFADAEGKTRFRLEDGREFKSPSSAGSAVMGGVACNGWRFWSLEGQSAPTDAEPTPVKKPRGGKPKAATKTVEAAETDAREEVPATE